MENAEVIRRWYQEVWNEKNEAAIDRYLSDTCTAHGLLDENNQEIVGTEKFKTFFLKFVSSFPDIKIKIIDIINEGKKTACLVEASFSHTGAAFEAFPGKSIKAASQQVSITGMTLTIIDNGKIQEAWNCFDFLKMYALLGAF